MTWGDALAALIGRRIGRHRYQIWGSERSWEGSAAMFVASAVAMFLVLLLLPGSLLSPHSEPYSAGGALSAAVVGAALATLVKAVSPHGTDNLSVPLVAAVVAGGTTDLLKLAHPSTELTRNLSWLLIHGWASLSRFMLGTVIQGLK